VAGFPDQVLRHDAAGLLRRRRELSGQGGGNGFLTGLAAEDRARRQRDRFGLWLLRRVFFGHHRDRAGRAGGRAHTAAGAFRPVNKYGAAILLAVNGLHRADLEAKSIPALGANNGPVNKPVFFQV